MAMDCRPEEQKRLMVTPGHDIGKAGAKGGDARHVHAGFGFGHGAAEDHVLDFVLGDGGILVEKRLDDGGGHVVRTGVAERAFVGFADGRSKTVDDNGGFHAFGDISVPSEMVAGFLVTSVGTAAKNPQSLQNVITQECGTITTG